MDNIKYKSIRESLELSQNQLARRLGVTVQTISQRENGTVKIRPEAMLALRCIAQDMKQYGRHDESLHARLTRQEFESEDYQTFEQTLANNPYGPGRIEATLQRLKQQETDPVLVKSVTELIAEKKAAIAAKPEPEPQPEPTTDGPYVIFGCTPNGEQVTLLDGKAGHLTTMEAARQSLANLEQMGCTEMEIKPLS